MQLGYFWCSVIPLCFGTDFLLRGPHATLRLESTGGLGIILLCATVQAVWLASSGTFETRQLLVIHFVALICQLGGTWAVEAGQVRRLSGVQQEAIVDLLVDDVHTGDRSDPWTGVTCRRARCLHRLGSPRAASDSESSCPSPPT